MSPEIRVVVVSGAPGAGKTTVARLLADGLSPSVHLHSDDFWGCIRRGRIPPFLPESHRQNQIVVDVLARAAFGYAAGGYHVMVDGIVGPWFLDPFRAVARESGVSLHYVVLRPDEATTLRRATTRGGHALTDPEPVRSLYRQFSDLGALESHTIDSTGHAPSDTAEAVRTGIDRGVFLLSE